MSRAGGQTRDPDGSEGKESACNSGGLGSIPGLGGSPGGGNGNSLQYSCPRQVGTCEELIYSVVPVSEEAEKGYRQGMLILQKETRNYKKESRKVRIFICRDKS